MTDQPRPGDDLLRQLVREVLRDVIREELAAALSAAPGPPSTTSSSTTPNPMSHNRSGSGSRTASAASSTGGVHRILRGAVTERAVTAAAAAGARLEIGPRAVLTPLAKDRARMLGVVIERTGDRSDQRTPEER